MDVVKEDLDRGGTCRAGTSDDLRISTSGLLPATTDVSARRRSTPDTPEAGTGVGDAPVTGGTKSGVATASDSATDEFGGVFVPAGGLFTVSGSRATGSFNPSVKN